MKLARISLFLWIITALVFSYLDLGNGTCICNSCTDCNVVFGDIQNAGASCHIIKLNQSISFSGTCIEAKTDVDLLNITLDCQGFWINGTNSSNDVAIYFYKDINPFSARILNCKINGGRLDIEFLDFLEINNLEGRYENSTSDFIFFDGITNLILKNSKIFSKDVNTTITLIGFTQNFTIMNSILHSENTGEVLYLDNAQYIKIENATINLSGNFQKNSMVIFDSSSPDITANVNLEIENSEIYSINDCLHLTGNHKPLNISRSLFYCNSTFLYIESGNFSEILIRGNNVTVTSNEPPFKFKEITITSASIYNNIFNFTNSSIYLVNSSLFDFNLNTTKTPGTNIVGGPYLGGNYWVGFSEACNDTDKDGICDEYYNISGYIDWLPLTNWAPTAPTISYYYVRSNFSLSPPYKIKFWYDFSNYFRFDFDIGGKNYSVILYNNKVNITKGGLLLYSYDMNIGEPSTLEIDCSDKLIVEIYGKKIIINDDCSGGKVGIGCDRCKVGPLAIGGRLE